MAHTRELLVSEVTVHQTSELSQPKVISTAIQSEFEDPLEWSYHPDGRNISAQNTVDTIIGTGKLVIPSGKDQDDIYPWQIHMVLTTVSPVGTQSAECPEQEMTKFVHLGTCGATVSWKNEW